MTTRKPADILNNLQLMAFMMDYFEAIDKMMHGRAVKEDNPARYLPPNREEFVATFEEIHREIKVILRDKREGKETEELEEKLLRRFARELTEFARFAASRTS